MGTEKAVSSETLHALADSPWVIRKANLPPMPDTLVPLGSLGCGAEGGL